MKCLNPKVRINKMVNKHTVDYQPSPSEVTWRIHLLIFLWTPKGFVFSPEYFLNFFSNLYIGQWLRESCKFMVLRLLENAFVSQKNESVHFYLCPKQKSLLGSYHNHSRHEEITHFSHTTFFVFFFSMESEEDYGDQKMTKIKLARVLVTSFDKFHHFCNYYIFGFCSVVP